VAHGLILLYHRVADLANDPYLLAVSPEHFAEHLAVMAEVGQPVALRHLLAGGTSHSGRLPITVTLDDGYADALECALPLLEANDTPATVFVASGAVGAEREFWWDELERLILQAQWLPARLELRLEGDNSHWSLPSNGARLPLFYHLGHLLRSLEPLRRDEALVAVRQWAGAEYCSDRQRPTHRTLRPVELERLAAHDLIEIGAHTVTHSALAYLPLRQQMAEIRQDKACLEEWLDRPVSGFAYPFGEAGDYGKESVALVRHAGFSYACTNVAGFVGGESDRFRLPRLVVTDMDGEAFARCLHMLRLASAEHL
jgi:peptidoglycan/xylan/chitin deacetylase (PgdA/CDA1 family)